MTRIPVVWKMKVVSKCYLRETRPRRQRQMNSRWWCIQSRCSHWCMIQFIVPSVGRCNALNFIFLLDDTLTNSSGWAFVFCQEKKKNNMWANELKIEFPSGYVDTTLTYDTMFRIDFVPQISIQKSFVLILVWIYVTVIYFQFVFTSVGYVSVIHGASRKRSLLFWGCHP